VCLCFAVLIDWLAIHSRAIAFASLPFVVVLVTMGSAQRPWYYAVLAAWLIVLVWLASRLQRLRPGALTPKKSTWASMPSTIAWTVGVVLYGGLGGYFLLRVISHL
jgi:uncharacterized membrane protein